MEQNENKKETDDKGVELVTERPKLSGLKQYNINPHNYDIYGGEPKSHSESMYENYYAHLGR